MITKIAIKNFGSIKDEVKIKFNKDVTTFIGKNESGKSTLLRAIDKLNNGKILESEKNVLLREKESSIEATFRLEEDEIASINLEQEENTKYQLYKFPDNLGTLYFTKKVDESESKYYGLYYLKEDKKGKKTIETSINSMFIENVRKTIAELLKNESDDSVKNFLTNIKNYNEDEIKNELSSLAVSDDLQKELEIISSEIKKNNWINLLPKYHFISFSSFKDILSDNVSIDGIESNLQALNILKVANLDLEKIKKAFEAGDEIALGDMETEYLEIVSKKFKEIFQQTDENFKLKIRFGTQKKEIIFSTQDKTSDSKAISLSQRSDGFKWYLSLYLTLFEYLEKNESSIKYVLLLDEPNLYLHPGAQKNLLFNVFYKEFSDLQIIYTTHSPYMIDVDNSFSLRIVEKNKSTNIYNSTREYADKHSDLKDVDTMTPLLTALDLNISNDLIYDSKDKIFVVEGIQDVYIIRAMINKLKYRTKMKNIKFISGTSAEKVPLTYSYLFGMGYNVYTLVDKDNSGIKANKQIVEESEDNELYVNLLNYDIINDDKSEKFLLENLYSDDDLEKYIPEKNTIYYKRVYDNYETYDFTDDTIANFKKLFDILIKK